MSELRRDPIIGRWVIVKTEDYWKPEDYHKVDNEPYRINTSPFIYERESMTPPEVDAFRDNGSGPNSPGWKVRTVPNKFPALRIEGDLDQKRVGVYDVANGIGAHEVIIENPDPSKQMADYSLEELRDVLLMYQRRCLDLTGDVRFKYIILFKNFGESAGASIEHAHSQLIALPMVPKYIEEKLEGAENYYKSKGRSVYGDMLKQEMDDQERIVTQNDDFLVFCPFVPRYTFETWIMPKDIQSSFKKLTKEGLMSLSQVLKEALSRIKKCLSNPSFNFYLQIGPINYEYEETFLWHIEIVPKLEPLSEFDWDTGFYVIRTPPHAAAQYLREVEYSQ